MGGSLHSAYTRHQHVFLTVLAVHVYVCLFRIFLETFLLDVICLASIPAFWDSPTRVFHAFLVLGLNVLSNTRLILAFLCHQI